MKEIYIDIFNQIYENLIERGYSEKDAEELASERAYDGLKDHYADMADNAYQNYKDNR